MTLQVHNVIILWVLDWQSCKSVISTWHNLIIPFPEVTPILPVHSAVYC